MRPSDTTLAASIRAACDTSVQFLGRKKVVEDNRPKRARCTAAPPIRVLEAEVGERLAVVIVELLVLENIGTAGRTRARPSLKQVAPPHPPTDLSKDDHESSVF